MSLNYRYGLKINAGYRIFRQLSAVINYGSSTVDFDYKLPDVGISNGAQKTSSIYGAALIYDINKKLSVKTAYDYQNFKTHYLFSSADNHIILHSVKLGLIYNF